MENMNLCMQELRTRIREGEIVRAYRYLFDLFSGLAHALKKYPGKHILTAAPYHGYLDMSYLPVSTPALKSRGLKIALVFNYAAFRFEIWLSAANRNKRSEMLRLFCDHPLKGFEILHDDTNTDAILTVIPGDIRDYNDKNGIIALLDNSVLAFIDAIERSFSDRRPDPSAK